MKWWQAIKNLVTRRGPADDGAPAETPAAVSGNQAAARGTKSAAVGGNVDRSIFAGDNAQIHIQGDQPHAPPRLYQLGPDLSDFVGREAEIAGLLDTLQSAGGGAAAISALAGLGGIGKSALAVHVAHRLAGDYPDGQLVLDLDGTAETPTPPMEVMGRVVRSAHPMARLPDDPATMTAIYRDLLSNGAYLLILDNARDANQVRELLPPPPSAAIVTSRQRIVLPNVRSFALDELSEEEARALLREIVGDAPSDTDLDRIATACARLPLALRVAGTFLAIHPSWTVDEYLSRLEDERSRLEALSVPEYELDVSTVLRLSVALLETQDPALVANWRKLSVFPGEFDRPAVAAVWDVAEEQARDGLDALLSRAMVLFDTESRRYRLHDLMRDMARLEGAEGTHGPLLDEARLRHAEYYLEVLRAADDLYLKGGDSVLEGLTLYDLEAENIEAGHDWAVEHLYASEDAPRLCYEYTAVAAHVLALRLHPRERIIWLEAGLAGTRATGDRHGEGNTLGNLGIAWKNLGDSRKAIEYYEQVLVIMRDTGDRRGEGKTLGNLGIAWKNLGDPHKAIEYHEQVLTITREIGNRRGEGNALGNLGVVWMNIGDPSKAIEYYEQQLTISREIGDRLGEGNALGNLGVVWMNLGDPRNAIEYSEQQLTITREIGDRLGEGNALFNSALSLKELGQDRDAVARAEAALEIYNEIEAPAAEDVRRALADWT